MVKSAGLDAVRYLLVLSTAIALGMFYPPPASAQIQLGDDIDATEINAGNFGSSVALSADGSRLVVRSEKMVHVYTWSESGWTLLGNHIQRATGDEVTISVSISADGNRLAVGWTKLHLVGPSISFAQVYEWSGSVWEQIGADIFGEYTNVGWGINVAISADGHRLVVGDPFVDTDLSVATRAGRVRVFDWNGFGWQQIGANIDGETHDELVGITVALSVDGNRLAIGLDNSARVYQWSGTSWQQIGTDLIGETSSGFGRSLAVSADGNRLAVGAPFNGGNDYVRLYQWSGSSWQQVGTDIEGEAEFDQFGRSVSLSADGNLLSVGAPQAFLGPGYVRLYRWSTSGGQQVGTDIVGEAAGDDFGFSVALSADGGRLALGNPSGLEGWGHVRVFSLVLDLSLVGLELVQVIQDWNNSVNLAAGKTTVARAHIQAAHMSPGSTLPAFRLRGYDDLGEGFFFPLEPPYIEPEPAGDGQSISFPPQVSADSRSNKLQSLTFHLPESWVNAVAPKRFNLESVDGPDLACLEDGPESGNCEIWATFSEQIPMTVHLIGSLFEQIGGPIYRTRLSDLKAVCSQIENRFPTHQVNCIYAPNPVVFPASATMPEARDILWEAKTRKWKEACEWDACQDFYLVVTAFSACDEEACSDPTVLGDANFPHSEDALSRSAWAIDASRPSAAAHQLGHNFGLHHTTNTYLSFINPESNKGGNCGEKAARAARYPPGSNTEFFPYYLATYDGVIPVLGPSAEFEELIYGYDVVANDVVPFLEKALMSECSNTAWPDIDSYNYLFQQLSDVETVTSDLSPEDPVGAGTDKYFLVTGTLDRETDQATFRPIQVVTPSFTPNPAPDYLTTEWALLVNSPNTGNVFYGLHLMPLPSDPSLAEFTAWVPYDSGTNLFWVWQGGSTPAGEVLASWSLPVISLIPPAPGTIFSNYEITLAWNASDGDGDDLTFLVEYSPDGGQSWVNLSSKWPASPFIIHSELIQASTNARFRVTAMDGFHSVTATMQGAFTVNHLGLIHKDGFE